MYELLVSLLLLGLFFLTIRSFVRRYGASKRNHGEVLVSSEIHKYETPPYHLFNNVTLKENGETTQIDHILITKNGIFVIETKHYAGWIFGSPRNKTWQQSIYNYRSKFPNPIFQNQKHIQFLSRLFKLKSNFYTNLVIFSGSAEFKTDLGENVIKLKDLKHFIRKEGTEKINERMMTYIVGRIEMSRLSRSRETDEYHRKSLEAKFRK